MSPIPSDASASSPALVPYRLLPWRPGSAFDRCPCRVCVAMRSLSLPYWAAIFGNPNGYVRVAWLAKN